MSAPPHFTHLSGDRIQWEVAELELIFGEIEYAFQSTPNNRYDSITLNWVLEQMQNNDLAPLPTGMAKRITEILCAHGFYNRSEAHIIELVEALIDNFGNGLKGYEKALSRVFEKEPISYISDIITPHATDVNMATPPYADTE